MATAFVVFGKVSSGQPVMDIDLQSVTITDAAPSTPCPAGYNMIEVTAVDADLYVAFAYDAATPDPSVNPRYYLPVGGKVSVS